MIDKNISEMLKERLSPEVYSIWANDIIPILNKIRDQSIPIEKREISLTECEIKVLCQAVRIWLGEFPDTGCKPTYVWKNELEALKKQLEDLWQVPTGDLGE